MAEVGDPRQDDGITGLYQDGGSTAKEAIWRGFRVNDGFHQRWGRKEQLLQNGVELLVCFLAGIIKKT